MCLAHLDQRVANRYRRMQYHALRSCVPLDISGPKRALQKINHRVRPERMQRRSHCPESLGNEATALISRDVPIIPELILHAGAALAVRLIGWRGDARGPCLQRLPVYGVRILYIDVKRRGKRLAAPRKVWSAAAHHQPRIANSYFRVVAARRPDRTEGLFRSEDLIQELVHRRDIVNDQIRCGSVKSLRNETWRSPGGLPSFLHLLKAPVHLIQRQVLSMCGDTPFISE